MSPHPPPTVPSTLLPELLVFCSPQHCLTMLLTSQTMRVHRTVRRDGKIFLLRCGLRKTSARTTADGKDWRYNQGYRQGLVAFRHCWNHILISRLILRALEFAGIYSRYQRPSHRRTTSTGLRIYSLNSERELELMTGN